MQVSKESDRVRRMFGDISPSYDLLNHVLSLNVDRSWRRRTARELGIRPGDRLLDICTGTADLALELASRVRIQDGGLVLGIDFCPEMVAIGEAKRSRRNDDRVTLLVADALELPFPDASFDAVTVAFGIRNVCDLRRGIREMGRVARPGGKVAILEFATPRWKWVASVYGFYFHRILPRIGGWLSNHPAGREAYAYLPESVKEFPRPGELSALLEESGLGEVRCRLLTGGIAALHLATRPLPGGPGSTRARGAPRRRGAAENARERTEPWKKP